MKSDDTFKDAEAKEQQEEGQERDEAPQLGRPPCGNLHER